MSSELTFQPADGELPHADWTPAHKLFTNSKSDAFRHLVNSLDVRSVELFTASSGNINALHVSENLANSQPQIPSTLSNDASFLHAEEGSKLSQETLADAEFVNQSAQTLHPITAMPRLLYKVQANLMSSSDVSADDSQRSFCSGSRSILGTKNLLKVPLNGVDERLILDRAHHRCNLNYDQIDMKNCVVPCWVKQEEDVAIEQEGSSSCRLSQRSEFGEVVNADASLLITPDIEVSSIINSQTIKQEVEDELADGFGIFPDRPNEQLHVETNAEISSACKLQTKRNANKDAKFILTNQEQMGYVESVDEAVNDGQLVDDDDGLEIVPNLSQFERFGIKNCSVILKRLDVSEWKRYNVEIHVTNSGVKMHTGETPFTCSACGKTFVKNSLLKKHKRVHTGENHTCSYCGKKFSDSFHLKVHERIHTGDKPYACSHCGKTFVSLSRQKTHEKIHTGEKPHACSHCGKKFLSSFHRERHERIHTGDKPYACSYCGKTFGSMSYCKVHERIHTGEKPHACLHCGKKFVFSSQLKVHERIHTGEKPYECSYCGKKFVCTADCKIHERSHTGEKPYACLRCGKTFSSSSHRNVHERSHTGEKPYACSQCGKKFISCSERKRHERIHTGEKPYACSQCGKRFRCSSFITAHRKVHIGDVSFIYV